MANRTFYPSSGYGSGRVYLEFSFLANGASNPTGTNGVGTVDGADAVASISLSATGTYTVTLKDNFNKIIYATAEIDDSVPDGAYATVGLVSGENTANPLVFKVYTRAAGGSATNMAANRRVQVSMALRNGNWGTK